VQLKRRKQQQHTFSSVIVEFALSLFNVVSLFMTLTWNILSSNLINNSWLGVVVFVHLLLCASACSYNKNNKSIFTHINQIAAAAANMKA